MENTTLVIDEKEKENAKALSQSFVKGDVKSRAFINALGAEVCLKYLRDENIVSGNVYNMHNIRKILEEFDISDIMLSNIHIDVRVVYDENQIFIPKSHFEYNITPDIYVVLKMAKDCSQTELLGFFEPKMLNKNNSNDKYYFIEKEKLSAPVDLKNFINNFEGKSNKEYDEKEIEDAEILMISIADNDITEKDTKKLFDYLKNSSELRDKFIEFENFEMISYQAANTADFEERFVNSNGVIEAETTETENTDEILEDTAQDNIIVEDESQTIIEEETPTIVEDEAQPINEEGTPSTFEDEAQTIDEEETTANIENTSAEEQTLESGKTDDDANFDSGFLEDLLNGVAAGGAEIAGAAVASAALSGAEEVSDIAKDAEDTLAGLADMAANTEETEVSQKNISESESLLSDALNSLLGQDEQRPVSTPFGYNTDNSNASSDNDTSDDIVFSNDDNYDDIVFEDGDIYDDNSSGSSSGKAYLPSSSNSKPAISTVINTPISEATDLISIESLQMGDIPPLDVPKADPTDMMQMDEFQNLVDNYVPQKIKDESVCVDFNTIHSDESSDMEGNPSSADFSAKKSVVVESDAFVEEMPEAVAQKEITEEDKLNSDSFVEEMPEELPQNEFDKKDELSSDNFVQDMPEELSQNKFEKKDELSSDNFVQDMPEELSQNEFAQKNELNSDETDNFNEDMQKSQVVSGALNADEMSVGMDMNLAVGEDVLTANLGSAIDNNELTIDESAFDDFGNVPSLGEEITNELNDEIAMSDDISASIDMSAIDNHVNESLNMDNQELSIQENAENDISDFRDESQLQDNAQPQENIQAEATQEENQAYDEISDLSILDELSALSGEGDVLMLGNDTADSGAESEGGLSEEEEAAVLEHAEETGASDAAEPINNENVGESEDLQQTDESDIEICEEESQNEADSVQGINSIDDINSIEDISDIEYQDNAEDEPQNQSLGILYGNSNPDDLNSTIREAEQESYNFKPKKSSSKLIPVFGFLTFVIIVGAVVGFMIKSKNSIESETLISSNPDNSTLASPETDNSGILSDNGIEPAVPTDLSPSAPAPKAVPVSTELSKEAKQAAVNNTKQAIKNTKEAIKKQQAAAGPKKPINASKSITLQKISWEVPDYLSYSDNMRRYLQTAGKSIKLTLSSDLLLTNDYIYSNQVKVSLKLSKDGTIQSAQVTKSSGSNRVDNIVLQTVKNTLNAVKPAQGEVPTPSYNLGIIIYL